MRGICRVIIASVLSLGVPPEPWIAHSLVGLVEQVLLGCSGYFFCLYYRKEEADV